MFNITFTKTPLVNTRMIFNAYYHLLHDINFREKFRAKESYTIHLPDMDWHNTDKELLLTLILQRAIFGIEAYLPEAVWMEATNRECYEKGDSKFIKNPYELGNGTVVDIYYHKLPAQLCEQFSLKISNNNLWAQNKKFYKEIRNRIFHGQSIQPRSIDGVLKSFQHIGNIYNWIDTWHNTEPLKKMFPQTFIKYN